MAKPLTALLIAAVILGGTCVGIAEPFFCGSANVYNGYYDRHFYRGYGDLYDCRYKRDIYAELQRDKDDREIIALIKKFPPDDLIQSNLQKRMEAIISTNFTANTNAAPMEIVPGLSRSN